MIGFLFFSATAFAQLPEEMLYAGLDSRSITEQLAFYHLHPDSEWGQKALKRAWNLLTCSARRCGGDQGAEGLEPPKDLVLPVIDIQGIISLVTRQSTQPVIHLKDSELILMEEIGAGLANRSLTGAHLWNTQELLALPSEEIDLARALLLDQFGADKEKIKQYEAGLDLMALQIAARLSPQPTGQEIVQAINQFIFHEMKFHFPPHSIYAKKVDLYTFLPSVMDGRQGVCLGVSTLYLCIAQRLGLKLEIITPPGHIYLRHEGVNIETTARGIDLPSDTYLGINTRSLHMCTMKEVVGMAFFNQAGVAVGQKDYTQAIALYEKALLYQSADPHLKTLLGINYLFVGEKKRGEKLLQEVRNVPSDDEVAPEPMVDDYLSGRLDIRGIKALFRHVDDTPQSIVKKQKKLIQLLKRCPACRSAQFQLAVTHLQLGRESEAYKILEQYQALNSKDPTSAYYLSLLALDRRDYNKSWSYLKQSEEITAARGHHPKPLSSLRQQLRRLCPED